MADLLPTQMFPRLPARATFVADTNLQKMFLILFRNILCPQQMFPTLRNIETQHSFCVPRICAPKEHHEQQCVSNKVSSFARTFSCRHKCFPVCLHGQHLLRDTKNVSDFVQKHFVSATNVSQFAQPKKHHKQQCVRNNVSSFARTFSCRHKCFPVCLHGQHLLGTQILCPGHKKCF